MFPLLYCVVEKEIVTQVCCLQSKKLPTGTTALLKLEGKK